MYDNRVMRRYEQGQPSFGAYVMFPSAMTVEAMALSGLDFVRMDPYHATYNPETFEHMVRAAYSYGITSWARVKNDPWTIMAALDTGLQAVTVPNVGTVAEAKAYVAATRYPPDGEREMARPLRMRNLSMAEYIEWSRNNVIISCQIEGNEGIENYRDIVKVDGLNVIQTGRGDISLALGLPGQEFHPDVLAIERRIVDAALEAGKQVSLLLPMTEDGIERSKAWVEYGVRIITLGSDSGVIQQSYRSALKTLQG